MIMGCKGLLFGTALVALAGSSAAAQGGAAPAAATATAAAPVIDFATDAEVRALIAKAKAARVAGQPMSPPLPLVRVPGYRAVVEYRAAPTPATSHDHDAEIMYVVEGSGTLVIGGTLADPKRPNDSNVTGSRIDGGTPHPLAPGAFIFVPQAVPHHFARIGPDGLSVVTMHIPVAP